MRFFDKLRGLLSGRGEPREEGAGSIRSEADPTHAIVLGEGAALHLFARTERALSRLGVPALRACDGPALARALGGGARWIVQAGAFDLTPPPLVPASATGRPVAALGMPLAAPEPALDEPQVVAQARELLQTTGGDLSGVEDAPFASLLLDDRLAERAALHAEGASAREAIRSALWGRDSGARVVHLPSLDVPFALEVRAAEVVTSLQIGGAERIARDLARGLARAGVSARLFALGRPTRSRWPALPYEVDLGQRKRPPEVRLRKLIEICDAWGADVAHAHLFGPDVQEALREAGYPVVVTIHNARQGWPPGTRELSGRTATLVLACAKAVEQELRKAGVIAPIRTAYNGVEAAREDGPALREDASALRRAWGARPHAIVVLIVANPRPQKRFDRVPAIVAKLAEESGRPVHVVWAGAASETSQEASHIAARLTAELSERGVGCHALGAKLDLGTVFHACDVLLGTSEWEGLSLSHLEALSAGLPIVVTRAGGTQEIAEEGAPGVTVMDVDAPCEEVSRALAQTVNGKREAKLPAVFEVGSMVRCHARMLARAAASFAARGEPSGVLLVTNNFSPGGAQSSARRLLLELQSRGHRASAVTLQEEERHPTPGTSALRAAGVPVVTIPSGIDAADAAERIAALADTLRPEGVLFWNVIAEHKVLLADLLWGTRVVDVSPGEMYFRSLHRYFERPRPDSAIRTARDYGARLAAAVVKFEAERALAESVLGCETVVIPNGVPLRERRARSRLGADAFVFGTAVRIHPDKRLELLIDAFERVLREVPHAVLSILGAPDAGAEAYAEGLRARTERQPVRWLGFSDEVGPFLDTLDAFVLVAEPAGCPNASLEALGAGLPVIATEVGGIREQLGDGAGLLAPRDDAETLARAMAEVARSPELGETLAAAAQARAKERFGLAAMGDRYAGVLGLRRPDGLGPAGGS